MRRFWALPLVFALTPCAGPARTAFAPPASNSVGPVTSTATAGLPPTSVPGAADPAITQANLHQTVCVAGYSARVRPPTSYTEPIKLRLLASAGIPSSQASRFELDHRDPIETAGDPRSLAQLWLEPWDGVRGAHAKDVLEGKVHRDLCAGRATLAQVTAFWMGDFWTEPVP